jgi:hypothetical protein
MISTNMDNEKCRRIGNIGQQQIASRLIQQSASLIGVDFGQVFNDESTWSDAVSMAICRSDTRSKVTEMELIRKCE